MMRLSSENNERMSAGSNVVSRRKLIILVALLLLTFMLGYKHFSGSRAQNVAPSDVMNRANPQVISSGIDSVIREFGISDKWIRNAKQNKGEQLWFSKEIRLPVDLPSVNVNSDITVYLRSKGLDARSTEDPRSKNVRMDVLRRTDTSTAVTGRISLVYSDSVKRASSEVCIVLDSLEHLSTELAGQVLSSAEEFSVIMPLRNDKADIQSMIMNKGRDHILELRIGDENSFGSDFRSGMNVRDLRSKIRSLCTGFPSASGVILYGSDRFPEEGELIKAELQKYNMKVYDDSVMKRAYAGEAGSYSIAADISEQINSGNRRIVFVTSSVTDNPDELWKGILPLKKRGNKFMEFGLIMNKNQEASKNDSASVKSLNKIDDRTEKK